MLLQARLVTRLFMPNLDGSQPEPVYTLSRTGARQLARLRDINESGLAAAGKPSWMFLAHGLRISDFMCDLEKSLIGSDIRLLAWKSERQLKPIKGRAFRVPYPTDDGGKISIIPDGIFSLQIGDRVDWFALEADRGTCSAYSMKKKMMGYIETYRRGLHRSWWGIPHFRVLLVTTTPYRREKLRDIYRDIWFCPNMWWFSVWKDITPETILGPIWLKCKDWTYYSLME